MISTLLLVPTARKDFYLLGDEFCLLTMKKLSDRKESWSLRKQRFEVLREHRECGYKKASKQKERAQHASNLAPIKRVAPAHFKYYAPSQQRKELEVFFEKINSHLVKGKRVKIDFSKVKQLYPCGVLVLMGWIDEWYKKYPAKLTANYPAEDLVEQMLCHVGVLEKLGLKKRKESSHNDVLRWHYMHENDANAEAIENFLLELQEILGEEKQVELGGCISEAMTNVRHHAYQDGQSSPWWIFSTVSEGNILIALHDRGMTIPKTVRQKPKIQEKLLGIRSKDTPHADIELITAAVGGRTRTGLPYRGRGLSEMLEFTKKYQNSELGIFSNRGFFRFDGQEHQSHLEARLNGTLIIWQVRLPEEVK